MNNKIINITFLITILTIAGCTYESKMVKLVDSYEFDELTKDDVFIIQTRTPYEPGIKGTHLVIEDYENVRLYQEFLPKDKNKKILIYCRSGRRSSIASTQLLELGYTNVHNLEGGMIAWTRSGKEIGFNQ